MVILGDFNFNYENENCNSNIHNIESICNMTQLIKVILPQNKKAFF